MAFGGRKYGRGKYGANTYDLGPGTDIWKPEYPDGIPSDIWVPETAPPVSEIWQAAVAPPVLDIWSPVADVADIWVPVSDQTQNWSVLKTSKRAFLR
jgi:hypothetical protein